MQMKTKELHEDVVLNYLRLVWAAAEYSQSLKALALQTKEQYLVRIVDHMDWYCCSRGLAFY